MIRQRGKLDILHRNGNLSAHLLLNTDPQRNLCIICQHKNSLRKIILNTDILFYRTTCTSHGGNIYRYIHLTDIGKLFSVTGHPNRLRLTFRIDKLIACRRFSGNLNVDRDRLRPEYMNTDSDSLYAVIQSA